MKNLLIFGFFVIMLSTLFMHPMEKGGPASHQSIQANPKKSYFNYLPAELKQHIVKFLADDQQDLKKLIENILSLRLINKEFAQTINDPVLWENIFANFFQEEIVRILNAEKTLVNMDEDDLNFLKNSKNLESGQILIKAAEEQKNKNSEEANLWNKTIIPALSIIVNEFKLNLEILESIVNNDKARVISLIAQKNNIKTHGIWHANTLLLAAQFGRVEIVQILIDAGVDINAHGKFGFTPLIAAAYRYFVGNDIYLKITKMLIDNGADIEAKDNFGRTALIVSSRADILGSLKTIKLLLDAGANINAQDPFGNSALITALNLNRLKIVELLIDNGADLNLQTNSGDTALMIACENSNVDAVQLLIQYGAQVNLQNIFGYTALMKSIQENDEESKNIVQTLLKLGANVNLRAKDGNTALSIASKFNCKDIIKLLIEAGATLETAVD